MFIFICINHKNIFEVTIWDFQLGAPRFSIETLYFNITHIDYMELTEIERIENNFFWESGITKVIITSSSNCLQFWNWTNGEEVYKYEIGKPGLIKRCS